MGASYRILVDGSEVGADLHASIATLEVEENAELPGAIQLTVPIDSAGDDLTHVGDPAVQPHARLAVVVGVDGNTPECIFDGFVLSNKLHMEKGATDSTLEVWGQDASWMMNLEEKVREWPDATDATVANDIFAQYGITASPENTADDSPAHVESGHTLMQRGSDIQFLRRLARRTGKLCRVAGTDEAGKLMGYSRDPAWKGSPPSRSRSMVTSRRRSPRSTSRGMSPARPRSSGDRYRSARRSPSKGARQTPAYLRSTPAIWRPSQRGR